jgi:hypothetical protein
MNPSIPAGSGKVEARSLSPKWAPTLPYEVAFDPRLSAAAVRVALALEYHARGEPVAWPTNETLAKKAGFSIDHIRKNVLPELEKFGWLRRGHDPGEPGRRRKERGEILILMWAKGAHEALAKWCPDLAVAEPDPGHGGTPVPGGEVLQYPRTILREESHLQPVNGTVGISPSRDERPEAEQAAQEAPGATLADPSYGNAALAAASPPGSPSEPETTTSRMTTEQGIAALTEPGGRKLVDTVAGWIADDLQDHASFLMYAKVCRLTAKREEPPDRVRHAYRGALALARDPRRHQAGITPGKMFTRLYMSYRPHESVTTITPMEGVEDPVAEAAAMARREKIEAEHEAKRKRGHAQAVAGTPRPSLAVVQAEPPTETPEQEAARLQRQREQQDAAAEIDRKREQDRVAAGQFLTQLVHGTAASMRVPARRKYEPPAKQPAQATAKPPMELKEKPPRVRLKDARHYLQGTSGFEKRAAIRDLKALVTCEDPDIALEAVELLAAQGITVELPEIPVDTDTDAQAEPDAVAS